MEPTQESIKNFYDRLYPLLHQERCYYDFKRICEEIETIIRKRIVEKANDSSSSEYLIAASRLSHTIGKEVDFIKYHQDKMHKKNAAKVRANEYYEAIQKAYKQVYLDIFSVMSDEENQSDDKKCRPLILHSLRWADGGFCYPPSAILVF